jgi:hypothetical protein
MLLKLTCHSSFYAADETTSCRPHEARLHRKRGRRCAPRPCVHGPSASYQAMSSRRHRLLASSLVAETALCPSRSVSSPRAPRACPTQARPLEYACLPAVPKRIGRRRLSPSWPSPKPLACSADANHPSHLGRCQSPQPPALTLTFQGVGGRRQPYQARSSATPLTSRL